MVGPLGPGATVAAELPNNRTQRPETVASESGLEDKVPRSNAPRGPLPEERALATLAAIARRARGELAPHA
jgi:hypothetical protein